MLRSRYCFCILCAILSLALALAWMTLLPPTARADDPKDVSFIKDVAPILKEACYSCHDSKKRKGKLDMTTFENLRKGGENEDPIAPGKPEASHLVKLITTEGVKRMPPKESGSPLSKERIAVIQQWIKEGAKLDAGIEAKADLPRELRLRWNPPPPPQKYTRAALVNALAFTPDGKKLVVGGQHELTVWDFEQGKLEKRIATRAERAHAMEFLADGKLIVAGGRPGQEGDLRIYDLEGKSKEVDGVLVLDGVKDPSVMLKQLLDTDDSIFCLAVSSDGKRLAAGGVDRTIRVWDLSGGVAEVKLDQTIDNHADWVMGLAFSADGKLLFSGSRDKTAKVWDLTAKESVLTFPGHQNEVYAVVVSRDGKVGISAGKDFQVRMWNATGEAKPIRATAGHSETIVKLIVNPKQAQMATCSHDKTVRLWNLDNGSPAKTLSGHEDVVYAIAFSPGGDLIASGDFNGEVRVWKTSDGAAVKTFNASPGFEKK